MDQNQYQQYLARIRSARDATVAKDIDTDLLMSRHDYFGQQVCRALGIEYRNDIPLIDIFLEIDSDFDPLSMSIPAITPDNYQFVDNILFIIDYKVSVSKDSSIQTFNKYTELIGPICKNIGIMLDVVIIRANPLTQEVSINSDLFKNYFTIRNLEFDFHQFADLKRILYEKFSDDEEFLLKISHGDFTLTAPWTQENVRELYDHPIYREFKYSMPIPYRRLFEESLQFSAYSAEKWNTNLLNLKRYTQDYYSQYIASQAKTIFTSTGDYPKPSEQEILTGWAEMTNLLSAEKQFSNNINDQKPSGHFIWGEPDIEQSNSSIPKLLKVSKALRSIKSNDKIGDAFISIGHCCNIEGFESIYEDVTALRKVKAQTEWKTVLNKKLEPVKINEALVLWEQQFIIQNEYFKDNNRVVLLKDFFGIGKHKTFKDKTVTDTEIGRPKILDFNDKIIYLESVKMVDKSKQILSKRSNLDINKDFIYSTYSQQIKNASSCTHDNLCSLLTSNFWACLSDISTLMKNMLAVSQYNRHNTFRIATCANNNLFALVMPSVDIKTKRSTLVYCIILLHRQEDGFLNPGALFNTYKTYTGYISISKSMRLDKERCQRIVTSPGLFLTTSLLFKEENNNLDLNDIATFSFYTSVSVTKSLLSLTEPSRYMIMNSLALSSHVKDYIIEKFRPYTKTLFSVYVVMKIKDACISAYNQKSKIELRDVYLTDYEITQKGVSNKKSFNSIWFSGKVSLKSYINQIYLPFYFNAKGLHDKHHVYVDLAKTILEIEADQRRTTGDIWSNTPKKQHVNLPLLVHSISKNLLLDTSRHNHLRNKIENRNNFKRSLSTISTFTSSKSCLKIGDFEEEKKKISKLANKATQSAIKKTRIANLNFVSEEELTNTVQHATYKDLKAAVPNYTDHISTKVFDRLYELFKNGMPDKPAVELFLDAMKNHKKFYFTFFNKGQKTFTDREIFVGEFEAKMCLYLIERIAKERCKLNPDEMISEPGDSKMKALEAKYNEEVRYIIEKTRSANNEIDAKIEELQNQSNINPDINKRLKDLQDTKAKAVKLEINADMSKWSAQDVFYKYFWLIAMDPILYPNEKEHILYFFCNYMQKEVILPDELMCNILDQKIQHDNDLISMMTNNFNTNSVCIKRNWLQGNFNYTSSYIHTCAMSVFKDIVKEIALYLEGDCLVNSMVHSDDNHTSVILVQNKISEEVIIDTTMQQFERTCLAFGCQANMKKTYVNNIIKEFVSLFCISGEPFSVYGRFLLTSVGDCAYIGPYEDMASRLTSTQTAIKHGCPPSLAWVSIALNQWITFNTYNMLPGQKNDPTKIFLTKREELPLELFGLLSTELSTLALLGMDSNNVTFLTNLLRKCTPILYRRESIQVQSQKIQDWDLRLLSNAEIFYLKVLRYFVLDNIMEVDDTMGETSEMRGKSILTPRKFTTAGSMKKLLSYRDYQDTIENQDRFHANLEYMLKKPELLVTKGETKEDFMNSIIYRYNSKKFKESLSIQNPAQLFIEQILFSSKPVIDYLGLKEKIYTVGDTLFEENNPDIFGRLTFPQAYRLIYTELETLNLESPDIELIYNFCILNDPLTTTIANSLLMQLIGPEQDRLGLTCNTMPEMRNMKLIHHSPALVLKAYSSSQVDIPGVEIEELQRDLVHLEEFIEKTKLTEKITKKFQARQTEQMSKEQKLILQLKEKTKFYQICYEYIKSTEHKVKIFILPSKAYTSTDFCALIQGNLLKDRTWSSIHYLKPIISTNYKGFIDKTPALEQQVASECFKLISYFGDTFINEFSKKTFLNKMIESYTYKGLQVKHLLEIIEASNYRHEFMPILYWLGKLTQKDLNKYDAMKTGEKAIWNDWQINRSLGTGPINLKITGLDKSLTIIGTDDKLHMAELSITEINQTLITISGRKLLGARHGLRFELFSKITTLEEGMYYITYQKKGRNQYAYQIHTTESILRRNEIHLGNRTRIFNEIVPVCPTIIARVGRRQRITIETLEYFNYDQISLSRLKISDDEYATIKRAQLHKMLAFDGPDIDNDALSITRLMKMPELMTNNFIEVVSVDMVNLSRLLNCCGTKSLDDSLLTFSDEPMEEIESSVVETVPVFNICYQRSAKKSRTYRNALQTAIKRETNNFMEAMDFTTEGFLSNENLGCLEALVSIIDLLETNEWSTVLKNAIHLSMLANDFDSHFHTFTLPELFYEGNPIDNKICWQKIKEFVLTMPDIITPPWDIVIRNFKEKAVHLVDEKVKRERNFNSFILSLKKRGGRSNLEFV
ncbi:polymerase [Nyando virus]|uniref:RNA-directed RNA polymerase L n=1 Tax=Nyando virus TaxID=35316 RepID=A0A088MFN9_9VIRU|nr:polymerase [Nyando virus]AIN37020.1 polymerase [Nyando virus]